MEEHFRSRPSLSRIVNRSEAGLLRFGLSFRAAMILSGLALVLLPCAALGASSVQKINCGDIAERQFTDKQELHRYQLVMEPGEKIEFRVVPIGDFLQIKAFVLEPAGFEVYESDYRHELDVTTGQLSAPGTYELHVRNYPYNGGEGRVGVYTLYLGCVRRDGSRVEAGSGGVATGPAASGPDAVAGSVQALGEAAGDVSGNPDLGSFGEEAAKIQGYTAEATETLHGAAKAVEAVKGLFRAFKGKGKKDQEHGAPQRPVYTKAEQLAPASQPPVYAQPLSPVQHANGSSAGGGAPSGNAPAGPSAAGLRPADLAGQVFPRLGLGMPLEGEVTAGGAVAGCRFLADAGERLELTFERLSGAHDLTLIVVDPMGALAFETRLLANPRVETVLELRTRGEYTVGVAAAGSSAGAAARFKVDLGTASE